MYIPTYYFGNIPIEAWEYPVFLLIIIIAWFVSGYIRKRNISRHPEFRFFQWGLWAKIFGGLFFGIIYIFYYRGGDTVGYYASSLAYCKLLTYNFSDFLYTYFGPVTKETLSVFSHKTGEPLGYMYFNDQSRIVMKLVVPFLMLGGKSYFIAGLLISIFSYSGIWQLYRTFVYHFPDYKKNLAIAILFMPSVVFWGSGISKDSFTLMATGFFLSAVSKLITKRSSVVRQIIVLVISSFLIIIIKPYILLILLPGTLVWLSYSRIQRIRNSLIRYSIIPFTYLSIIFGSYGILTLLGGSLGKFSIEKALETAAITQRDLKQEYYQGNSFDIGEFEPTISGVSTKIPAATIAGLYRPYLWEGKNAVMLLSGLENFFILGLTIYVIVRIKWTLMYQTISSHPILICSFIFSLFFAFMIGLTTSNFGALVRFKIPLVPMYMSTLMILYSQLNRIGVIRKNKRLLIS
jgi:hypothetical protein